MPAYKCLMTTRQGNAITRTMVAASLRSLRESVAEEGYFLIKARKCQEGAFTHLPFFGQTPLRAKDFTTFNHEFILLLKAAVPVVSALDSLIKKEKNTTLRSLLTEIRSDVAYGESLSSAFSKHKTVFSPLYCAALKAGEADGRLPETLAQYQNYRKRTESIKQKVKAASVYPAILMVVSVFVVMFLLVFVVPSIASSFTDSGTSLPVMTRLLLTISTVLEQNALALAVMVPVSIALAVYSTRIAASKRLIDGMMLKLPVVGGFIEAYSVSRFSTTLASLIATGSTLNSALKTAAGLVGNVHIREGLVRTGKALEQGESFSGSLETAGVLPPLAVRMIAAGEQSGNLEEVLFNLSDYYENEVETGLTTLTSLIEPVLMVFMGFIIGFIVLAMYMPIFQLAGTAG